MLFFLFLSIIFRISFSSEYNLIFAILVTRHGDRTPVFDPLVSTPWNCTLPLQISTSPINDQGNDFRLFNLRTITPTLLVGTCQEGQLTQRGMREHVNLGKNLSKIYYPSLVKGLRDIRIRSSNQDRTIQSAQSFIRGFFPPSSSYHQETNERIDIKVEIGAKEDMFINFYATPLPCPILEPMSEEIRNGKAWQDLLNQTKPFKKEIAKKLGYSNYSEVKFFFLHDSLYCLNNNNIPFPGDPALSMDDYWLIEKYATYQYNELYYGNEKFLKLGIGHFLGESILGLFERVMQQKIDYKLMFYSAHDTTIAPLGLIFGLNDKYSAWPKYASNIRLELYQDENKNFFVKGLYNGKEKVMKGCDNVFCRWDKFYENSKYWVPNNWEDECKNN